ncbi:MAG: hypothetical protein AB1351_02335 [Thermoproteota archaeon]
MAISNLVGQRKLIAIIVAAGILSAIFVQFETAEAFTVDVDFPNDDDDVITQTVGGQTFEIVIDVAAGELIDVDSMTLIVDAGASGQAAAFDSNGDFTTGENDLVKDNKLMIDTTGATSSLGYVYGMGLISQGYSFATGSFSSSGGFIGGNTLGTSNPNAPTTQLTGFVGPGQITISGTLRTIDLADGAHTLDVLIDTAGGGNNVDQLNAPTFNFTVEEDATVVVQQQQVSVGATTVDVSTTDSDGDPININLDFGNATGTTGNIIVVAQNVEDFIAGSTEEELEAQGLEASGDIVIFNTTGTTFVSVGFIMDIDVSALGLPEGTQVTVSMEYDDSNLTDEQEERVRLMHQNDDGSWEALSNLDETINDGEDVDVENNIVYGTTDDFSLFAPGRSSAGNAGGANDDDDDDGAGGGGGGGGGGGTVVITWPTVETKDEAYFFEHPLERILVANSAFINAGGVSIDAAQVNQQISISGEFTNYQEVEQDYAFIVQVIDEDDQVVDIAWQQGTLSSGSTATVGTLWTPKVAGDYEVKIFVWDGISTSPEPLSEVTIKNIEVS